MSRSLHGSFRRGLGQNAWRAVRRFALTALLSVTAWSSACPVASANTTVYVHVVQRSETLASLAQLYYGDPVREAVLAGENGLGTSGSAQLRVGMRLVIPWSSTHRVAAGETWESLAERFYGDNDRAFVLMMANGAGRGDQPEEGAELVVPYPLRYVTNVGDTPRRIASRFYPENPRSGLRILRRFNRMRGRVERGETLLVPIADLELTDSGRQLVEQTTGQKVAPLAIQDSRKVFDDHLTELNEHVESGRYVEALALGNRLMGARRLMSQQVVTIQRALGTAYVAVGREDLAAEAFRLALRRQPQLELDLARTSPKVLAAFKEAKATLASSPARVRPAAPGTDKSDQ